MTTHTVTLVFEDGRTVQIPAEESQTVYLSALLKKVRLQTDCLEGACATCKALCTQGEYSLGDYSDEAMSDEEAAERYVLTCQMQPKSDCVIEFAYNSELAFSTAPATLAGRVSDVAMVSSTVARLELALDDPNCQIEFLPGQYVHLDIPGTEERRSYSFANPPEGAENLEFFIKVLPDGAMSNYVRDRAKAGDEMKVTGPFGKFYLRPPTRPIVMIAGGTGLAPMLSMFAHLIAIGGTDQPIHLLYGANDPAELFGLERIAEYVAQGLKIETGIAVVEAGPDWDGVTGFVTDLLSQDTIHGGDCDVYLCGPPPMIEAAEKWLDDAGVAPGAIHAERFLPS